MTKDCKTCGETLPLEQFYRNPRAKDGHFGSCKKCRHATQRRWQTQTEKGVEYAERRKKERHPLLSLWASMKRRCNSPSHYSWRWYGARCIKVCDRWSVFANFLEDMGERPSPQHQLDRIDPNGNYEPSNCRWVTPQEQADNRTITLFVEYNGERMPLAAACRAADIHYTDARKRLRQGLDWYKPRVRQKRGAA